MTLLSRLLCFSLLLFSLGCGPGHEPLTHTDLTGKWELIDVEIDSDYIDANPKFKEGLIDAMMGNFYTFSEEQYLTITDKKNGDEFGEYSLEENGHAIRYSVGTEENNLVEAEIFLENGNLSLRDNFQDLDGSTSYITQVLRKR